jgi:hypothetical protein
MFLKDPSQNGRGGVLEGYGFPFEHLPEVFIYPDDFSFSVSCHEMRSSDCQFCNKDTLLVNTNRGHPNHVDVNVVVDMVVGMDKIFAKVLIIKSTWLLAFAGFSSTCTSTTTTKSTAASADRFRWAEGDGGGGFPRSSARTSAHIPEAAPRWAQTQGETRKRYRRGKPRRSSKA